jgi:hypothetical protein
MTPLEKAERARELLSDPVMKAVFQDIRMEIVDKLESVPMGDIDTQHESALMLQLLKRLQSQLQKYSGDLAVEKHRQKQDSFIQRVRESLLP